MSKSNRCFGTYDYSSTCLNCPSATPCQGATRKREREEYEMYHRTNTPKEERKVELDKEWEAILPCAKCSDKMKRLCRFYNTFHRPDYPPIFHITITCDDKEEQIDEPVEIPTELCDKSPLMFDGEDRRED